MVREILSQVLWFFFSFFLPVILEPSQSHSHTKKRSQTTPAPVFPAGRDKKDPHSSNLHQFFCSKSAQCQRVNFTLRKFRIAIIVAQM